MFAEAVTVSVPCVDFFVGVIIAIVFVGAFGCVGGGIGMDVVIDVVGLVVVHGVGNVVVAGVCIVFVVLRLVVLLSLSVVCVVVVVVVCVVVLLSEWCRLYYWCRFVCCTCRCVIGCRLCCRCCHWR